MNVIKPCLVCAAIEPCRCCNNLLAFFHILERARDRVLSSIPASQPCSFPVRSAGIDKLDGYFTETVQASAISAAARAQGIPVKRTFLKDRHLYLEVGTAPASMYFRVFEQTGEIKGFVSNPNRFDNWDRYLSHFSNLVPESVLTAAIVTRLDLNLDFNSSFLDVIGGLDFSMKKNTSELMDESGVRTGLYVGKGDETIVVYDRAHKERVTGPWTRVELRLKGRKLPTRDILKIPNVVCNQALFAVVAGVTLHRVEGLSRNPKFQEFMNVRAREGFFRTKKAMNRSRNIHRDILSMAVAPWERQPSELFKDCIRKFMEPMEAQYESTRPQIDH